jgi:hypothetical protein
VDRRLSWRVLELSLSYSRCKRHHRAKHVGAFTLRLGVHGVDWETPIGRRYSVIADGLPLPIRFEFHLTQLYHYDKIGQLRR